MRVRFAKRCAAVMAAVADRRAAIAVVALAVCAMGCLASCAVSSPDDPWSGKVTQVSGPVADTAASSAGDAASGSSSSAEGSGASSASAPSAASGASAASSADAQSGQVTYPSAWLAVEQEGIPAGTAVQLLSAPGFDIVGHVDGQPVSDEQRSAVRESWDFPHEGMAVVSHAGKTAAVDPAVLLVNLPDVVPDAEYDVVYSYAATSTCAGEPIPSVTGERLDGYVKGEQTSAYWGGKRFVVPCALATAEKVAGVCAALGEEGYRLLVYDAYRPMRAQVQLSEAFSQALDESAAMQDSLGAWSDGWYVAPGASGHNYGTDIDAGLCDSNGEPCEMPSAYDTFDEAGRLTDEPMAASEIGVQHYRAAVQENDACMALHRAFDAAGFSELASEWWHFEDDETEQAMRAVAGDAGLDFVAEV